MLGCLQLVQVQNIIFCSFRTKSNWTRYQSNFDVELELEKQIDEGKITTSLTSLFKNLQSNSKCDANNITSETLGMVPKVISSSVQNAGLGVFVKGRVNAGDVVGIYPGVIYEQGDPALWPSWNNDYFLRRGDGSSVDGKFYGISGWFYNSSISKYTIIDDFGNKYLSCDKDWILQSKQVRNQYMNTKEIENIQFTNPLNTGHFINCASGKQRANVMYYEYDFMVDDYQLEYRKFIPNVSYLPPVDETILVKSIVMIALNTLENEELFSDYAFIGKKPIL